MRARRSIAAAKGRDVAIGFEDGPGDPTYAVTARRGTAGWELRVKGTPAHSSQVFRPDIGPGAIYEAARILNAFREKLSSEEHLTFNPGMIVGGTSVDLRCAAGARVGVRQDQRRRGAGDRERRFAHAVEGATRSREEEHAGDRRGRAAAHAGRRSRSTRAIRRSRRPRGTRSCSPCTIGRARTSDSGRFERSARTRPALPTCRSSPAKSK